MKKFKHNKLKNTGILFELLVRQITADTLENVKESAAGKLIRTYFNKSSLLSKELALYNSVINEKFSTENKASNFLDLVIEAHSKLNSKDLKTQKYNLIRDISENYKIDDFFKARIDNYKVLASTFNLFEYSKNDVNPKEYVNNRFTLIEHINTQSKKHKIEKDSLLEEYRKQDKEIRLLAYNLLVDKFNEKYGTLSTPQRTLLEKYINNVSNTTVLKEYVSSEATKLQKDLKSSISKVSDNVTRIKLKEVYSLLSTLKKGTIVKDEEVLSLMRYYDLVNELKSL